MVTFSLPRIKCHLRLAKLIISRKNSQTGTRSTESGVPGADALGENKTRRGWQGQRAGASATPLSPRHGFPLFGCEGLARLAICLPK